MSVLYIIYYMLVLIFTCSTFHISHKSFVKMSAYPLSMLKIFDSTGVFEQAVYHYSEKTTNWSSICRSRLQSWSRKGWMTLPISNSFSVRCRLNLWMKNSSDILPKCGAQTQRRHEIWSNTCRETTTI